MLHTKFHGNRPAGSGMLHTKFHGNQPAGSREEDF